MDETKSLAFAGKPISSACLNIQFDLSPNFMERQKTFIF